MRLGLVVVFLVGFGLMFMCLFYFLVVFCACSWLWVDFWCLFGFDLGWIVYVDCVFVWLWLVCFVWRCLGCYLWCLVCVLVNSVGLLTSFVLFLLLVVVCDLFAWFGVIAVAGRVSC